MEIITLPIESLTMHKGNAKLHPQEQIDQIKESIKLYGFNDPIGVWGKNNTIVEGHGRYMAAKEMGIDEVPCVRLDHLSDKQRREYMLVHNQTTMNSGWDFDLLTDELDGLDFDGFDFGFDLDTDDAPGEAVEDDYDAEPPVEPKAKIGDIYQLGRHRLMSKDDFAKLMGDTKARLCVTSPPYGVGKEYEEKGIEPWRDTISSVIDNIKDYALIVCWNIADLLSTGTQFTEPTSMFSTEEFFKAGYGMMYTRIWKKKGASFSVNPYHTVTLKPVQDYEWILCYARLNYQDDFKGIIEYLADEAKKANLSNEILKKVTGAGFMYGHWFTAHQWAMVDEDNYKKIQSYCREKGIKAFEKDYLEIRKEYDVRNIFQHTLSKNDFSEWGMWGIWEIGAADTKLGHPAPYPVELPSRCIKMHTREDDIVLEPFCGSGTTIIAAEQLNRVCYAMEYDPRYVDIIIDRWEKFTGEKAVKLN